MPGIVARQAKCGLWCQQEDGDAVMAVTLRRGLNLSLQQQQRLLPARSLLLTWRVLT